MYSSGSEEAGGQDWAVPSHYRSAPSGSCMCEVWWTVIHLFE